MDSDETYVEAIHEGRIVKVPEKFARREGLIILKKPEINNQVQGTTPSYYKTPLKTKNDYRKTFSTIVDRKPGWQEKQVLNELIENFHWKIRAERRKKNLTRRQLANLINDSDENLQILETGRLPSNDFVLINKIQKTLKINLRKDGKDFDTSPREIMEKSLPSTPKRKTDMKETKDKKSSDPELRDSDIEILDDEI